MSKDGGVREYDLNVGETSGGKHTVQCPACGTTKTFSTDNGLQKFVNKMEKGMNDFLQTLFQKAKEEWEQMDEAKESD